jgi:hypothetical protein
VSGLAFAQSSGNFSAAGTPASCKIGTDGSLSGGTGTTVFVANISTPSGNGTTLDIRPAFVTGLFTDTKISTTIPTATADIGIEVCVTVDGKGNADGAGIKPTDCVVYDQRFQQISSNLFSQLAECTMAPTTTVCTTDANCASLGTGFTCGIPAGATSGVCVGPNPLCDFDLILSTLSAHSFDFVVPVSNGKPHKIEASWKVIGSGATPSARVNSCVGPGIVSVEQVKVFQNSGSLSF